MEPRTQEKTQDLTGNIKKAGREARDIASEAAQELGHKMRDARNAVMEGARVAYRAAEEKTVACAKATDKAIHEKPYYSLGIVFCAGLLLGFLIRRK